MIDSTKTYTCKFCDKTYYCNKVYNTKICYHVGMIIKRDFVAPNVELYSGDWRLIQGKIKVNVELYDYLLLFKWQVVNKGYATSYAIVNAKPTTLRMHRLVIGAQSGQIVDHINRDRLDNRIENLRFVTAKENVINSYQFDRAKNYYYWTSGKKWVVKLQDKKFAYCQTEQEAIDYVEKYIKPLKMKQKESLV